MIVDDWTLLSTPGSSELSPTLRFLPLRRLLREASIFTPGILLIQNGSILPGSLHFNGNSAENAGWTTINSGNDLRQFKADLTGAQWSYFYMAGIKKSVMGAVAIRKVAQAVLGLTAKMRLAHCNSLQIDEITQRSFLGIPYTTVYAHCCHIQEGMVFASGAS